MGDIWKQAITARIHSEIIEKKIKVPALCLSLEQLLAPCKKTRYKGKRPRPQNVFVIYRKEVNAQISATTPDTKFNDISKIASNKWKNENQHVKDFFTLLSAVVQLIHCDVFPDYQYKPMPTSRQKRPQHRKMSQRPWQKSAVTPHIWAEIYSIKEGDHHEHNRGCTHESIQNSAFHHVQPSRYNYPKTFKAPSYPCPQIRNVPIKIISSEFETSNGLKILADIATNEINKKLEEPYESILCKY